MGVSELLDVDRPETWPAKTRDLVEILSGAPPFLSDGVPLTVDAEVATRATLGPRKVLAYHCTCLFPHETAAIRSRGLRLLTDSLVRDRITEAVDRKLLSPTARDHAEVANVYAAQNTMGRENQVCFVLGRGIFDNDPDAVLPLLHHWGGEAIRGGPGQVSALRTLGTPTIVVAQLDLAAMDLVLLFPPLQDVLAATLRADDWARADVHCRTAIDSANIVDIWQPGHPGYDRHASLSGDSQRR